MTQQSDNIDIIRKAYDGWHSTKGDANVWLDILADEIELRSQGDGKKGMEFTCTRNCKKDVLEYFEGLANDWTMEYYRVNEFITQGDKVIALCDISWTNKHTGKTATMPKADAWTFKDGKVIKFMEYFDTHLVIEASTA